MKETQVKNSVVAFLMMGIVILFLVLTACGPSPTLTPGLPSATAIPLRQTKAPLTPTPLPPSIPTPQGRTLLVTNPADSGPGTLRLALLEAQNGDTITFDPSVFPHNAPETITVSSELPWISQGHITIDANNAGVIIDGGRLHRDSLIPGIAIDSEWNEVRGLQIINFTGAAIALYEHASHNVIGDATRDASGSPKQGNVLSSNAHGVALFGASSNTIEGNLIGTDPLGANPLPNRWCGIWLEAAAQGNVIGPDNIIAFNGRPAIEIATADSTGNTITRNIIHDNSVQGILITSPSQNTPQPPRILSFDLQTGAVSGTACTNCIVEIFSDNGDEGAIFEGRTQADENGAFTFEKGVPHVGPFLTATATDPDGNTSEFSPPTQGTSQNLSLQIGNALPIYQLQAKLPNELADNRIGLSYGGIDPHVKDLNGILGDLTRIGAKRLDIPLHELEPPIDWSMSEYEYETPDFNHFVDELAENDIALNYIIHFWDKEGHAVGEALSTPRFQDEEQVQDYIDYVRGVVRHYKGRIPYYTIWSEPDYCGDGGIKCVLPEDYIALAKQVIPVIRQEDPQAKIASAPYVLFFARNDVLNLVSSDVVSQFDVISWHPLYDVFPSHKFWGNYYYEYPSIVREIQRTATAHGFEGEYWGTEIGWCSKESPDCHAPFIDYDSLETDVQAAKYYARGIFLQLGMDVVVGLGGLQWDTTWSMPTVRNLNTVMAGNKLLEIPVEIESDAANITSYGFSLPNGDRLFALWTDGTAVEYDPGVSAILTLPSTSGQKVIGIDVLNGFEQELTTETVDDNLVIRDLLVRDYPIILRFID